MADHFAFNLSFLNLERTLSYLPVYKYPSLTASFVKVRFIGCIIFFFIVCVGVRGWVDEEMVNITRHCLTQW